LSELCSREVATVRKTNTSGEGTREHLVTLVYLPPDSDESSLSNGVEKVTDYGDMNCNALDVMCQCTPHYMGKHGHQSMRIPNGIFG
jgi:hypothetical protein